jgi:very-short-patch-repair endonuclease
LLKQEFLTKNKNFNCKKSISEHVKNSIIHNTAFLDYDAPVNVRVSYVLAGITQQKQCLTCGLNLKFLCGYNQSPSFCSSKCAANSNRTKQKRVDTVKSIYGVSNVSQSHTVKEKMIDTFLKTYGVNNPSKSSVVKEKISKKSKAHTAERIEKTKQTVKSKYKVDHTSQLESVKKKKEQTFIKNYGSSHYFKTKEFKQKMQSHYLNKYGVDNPFKADTVKEKIQKTKNTRHGSHTFNNRPLANLTMLERFGDHCSRKNWSEETKNLIESPGQLKEFIKDKTIYHAADILSIAPTTLYQYLKKYHIDNFLSRPNQYEDLVKSWLEELDIDFVQNDRTIIPPFEIDFYIPKQNLCIEINGIFWHSELMGKHKHYHRQKTDLVAKAGFQLLHFWDYQFDKNPSLIKSMIKHKLNRSNIRVGARSTVIQQLTPLQYREFLSLNHIQGPVNSRVKLGLYYQEQLVAVLGAGASRFEKSTWELHRYAVAKDHSIVGAAGKLFKHLLTLIPKDTKIVSYASQDYSQGQLYRTLGFSEVEKTPPNYFYFKNRTVYNRMQFQKHKLKSQLPIFDSALSEWENMQTNGYNRFWDTGTIKYEYTR